MPEPRERPRRSAHPRCAPRLLLLLCVLGCGPATKDVPAPARTGKPVVYAVNPALVSFATRLGDDEIEVVDPIPADISAGDWNPTDDDVRAMQQADAILLNGAHFSKWTRRVSLPDSRLVDTSRVFRDDYVTVADFSVHSHAGQAEHAHAGSAPNTYLDPALALKQATAVRDALVRLLPDDHAAIEQRYELLANDLRAIDAEYTAVLKDAEPMPVLASHPFSNYVGRRAKWDIVHLHWSPREMPTDARWRRLEERLREHPAKWMLWSEPPSKEIADRLAELGITSVVLDDLARPPRDGDFLEGLRANLDRIRPIVTPASGGR